ncbi:MAG: hypothetical protein ACR2P4_00190 [Gammaproteobacteria bacterium]
MTKTMTNTIRAFLVLFFFGLLTACGSSGGGNTAASVSTPTTITVTVPTVPGTPEPVVLSLESPEMGAMRFVGNNNNAWFVVVSVAAGGENRYVFGHTLSLTRQNIALTNVAISIAQLNEGHLIETGNIAPDFRNGIPLLTVPQSGEQIAVENEQDIRQLGQLCGASWLVPYIDANFGQFRCPQASQLSYSPDMRRIVHAAMADTFHRGIGIGESNFAFSGRHNGNDRAAGFTYDMGGYALRTDYVHLPSKQDGAVFLDTFRFGILRPINDETRFFAGVDSYRNAILALDVNGDNLHRFGIAAGDGYAVRYELRIRL